MSKYIPDEDRDEIFKRLKMERANQFCAECGTPHPQWASATLGIFICYQCSGLHRSFGVHLSFVRSLNMDSWTPKQIYIMEHGGNQRFLDYSKSKGIPQGSPSSMKYQSRAFDDYRKMLSNEADAYLGTSSGASQQRPSRNAQSGARRSAQPQQVPAAQPTQPKKDPLDDWDGWGDMEASLAAIEKKQRSSNSTTPRSSRDVSPQRTAPRGTSPQPKPASVSSSSSSQQPKKQEAPVSSSKSPSSMDSLDGWSGWGDTESSLAEIERKQQQQQNRNQKNMAQYGGRSTTPTGKRYESLSSEEYFAQQDGGSSSSQPQQRTFQAYGQSSGSSSYQQGASPAITDALSSGWSKLSSFAKSVAQSTQKAVHDSGLYDAVQGLIGSNSSAPQRSSLLGEQSDSATTPRQQYSSSYHGGGGGNEALNSTSRTSYSSSSSSYSSSRPTSSTTSTTTTSAPAPKPQPQFVGPTAASQGLKPATGADDEFNELVHGGMSKSKGAKAAQPGDGPLLEDMPDVDAWLDSTLAMEAAKQANNSSNNTAATTSPAPAETSPAETAATSASTTEEGNKDGELGDDWDTW